MIARGLATGVAALLSLFAAAALAASLTAEADGIRVEVTSEPDKPVKDRKTTYTVRLRDGAGRAVTGARVTVTGRMADGMSVAAPLRASGGPGIYGGEVLFTMEGRWDLTVRIVHQGRRLELPFREDVGW